MKLLKEMVETLNEANLSTLTKAESSSVKDAIKLTAMEFDEAAEDQWARPLKSAYKKMFGTELKY